VGTRTTGNKAGNFVIVPPDWHGTLPAGMNTIVAPTPVIWVLGRTQGDGSTDFESVHKVQDGYKLTPLSQWDKFYIPPEAVPTDSAIDNKTTPFHQVNSFDGVAMLTRLATLMQKHPPHANDYPIIFRLQRIGLEAGAPFDASKLPP